MQQLLIHRAEAAGRRCIKNPQYGNKNKDRPEFEHMKIVSADTISPQLSIRLEGISMESKKRFHSLEKSLKML
ncbi:hypothetical protein [Paenibacillus sp. YYML68]|uniref:hypothetical protein n=1 Tax=Paenibacillus sp. YYML68 TaxID=2909250 RepID=UPI002493C4A6|nr:hypothetical protein [Paenibacillus sp. YYML68]